MAYQTGQPSPVALPVSGTEYVPHREFWGRQISILTWPDSRIFVREAARPGLNIVRCWYGAASRN